MTDQKIPKIPKNYLCEKCNYSTSSLKDFNKHKLTAKHKRLTNTYQKIEKIPISNFICECGKKYKHKQSLYNHKKKCLFVVEEETEEREQEREPEIQNEIAPAKDRDDMILDFMKSQAEFNQTIMTAVTEGKIGNTTNNNNNTTNNINNNQFNLNFFLNDTCKDALNITDFLDSIQLQLKDLEETGRLGHVNGISRIFVNALKNMDETQRPIHCTDSKRETLYIKDKDTWTKDNSKERLKSAIETVADRNIDQIPQWRNENPRCQIMDSKENAMLSEMTLNSIGQLDEEGEKDKEKIAKKIIKEVVIDK